MNFFNYKDFILTEAFNFKRTQLLSIDWWSVWKKENQDKYEIKVNAINKNYEIADKESGKLIFIYDYNRQRAFTNEKPDFFKLKDENITPEELTKVTNKEKEKIHLKPKEKKEKKEKSDDPLAGLDLNSEEE